MTQELGTHIRYASQYKQQMRVFEYVHTTHPIATIHSYVLEKISAISAHKAPVVHRKIAYTTFTVGETVDVLWKKDGLLPSKILGFQWQKDSDGKSCLGAIVASGSDPAKSHWVYIESLQKIDV